MPDSKKKKAPPILSAVDFSTGSANALVWAATAAEKFDQPLLVVHVVHDPGSAPGYYHRVKKVRKHLRRIEERAEEMMAEFLGALRKEHSKLEALKKPESVLVVGLPVNRILEIAKKHGANHIVMGSRGRTGIPSLLLGSKAQKVAQLSPIPVTIVKSPGGGPGQANIDEADGRR